MARVVLHVTACILLVAADVKELRAFETSLRRSPGALLDGLAVRQAAEGRGVFAERDFQEGDLVLRIPRNLCLQTAQRPDAAETAAALAWKLLEERRRGASPFQRYLQLLPALPKLHPLAAPWPVHLAGAARKLYGEAQQRFQYRHETEDFNWALGMVWTRAFAFGETLAMVPYLDLFNHWIPKEREDPLWNCRLQEWSDSIGLVADRDIAKGEELNHLYSEASDAQLLVQHGIPPPSPSANPFNEALLEVELPEDLRTKAAQWGFDTLTFHLPQEVSRLRKLARRIQDSNPTVQLSSLSAQEHREALLFDWLREGEMKLQHFLEAKLEGTPLALTQALKDVAREEALLLRRLRTQPPPRAAHIL